MTLLAWGNQTIVDGFSVVVSHQEVKDNGYSLNAGQYFDVNIEYVDITNDKFNQRLNNYKSQLQIILNADAETNRELMSQLDKLIFNDYGISE